MSPSTTTTGPSFPAPKPVSMHPLFHDLFIATDAPDEGARRRSRRRQVLTRTVRRPGPSTPTA